LIVQPNLLARRGVPVLSAVPFLENDVGEAARVRAGVAFGLIAYLWWGGVPLYFAQLTGVPAGEILAQRIAWSLPILLGITVFTGGWNTLFRTLANGKLVLVLLASSVFLATNWLLYIHATVTGRVTEASLGYYMMPLVNAALATAFLGERLRPLHWPALLLVALGVLIPVIAGSEFSWIAVSVPISFGLYSLVRKLAPVDSVTGLTVESLLMLVPSVGYLVWLNANGRGHFGTQPKLDALFAISGIITVVPLLTFNLALKRLPLLAVSFMQFISPTVQMILAVVVLGEKALSPDRWVAFACIWAAVALFIGDAVLQRRKPRDTGRSGLRRVIIPLKGEARCPS
jgi:chloramphenicol-sensitive protein RarD